jgi:hypothetical protein
MRNFMNDRAFAKGVDSLSSLLGLHFALYDNNQNLLLASAKQDSLLSVIKEHNKAREPYKRFIDRQLKRAGKERTFFRSKPYGAVPYLHTAALRRNDDDSSGRSILCLCGRLQKVLL